MDEPSGVLLVLTNCPDEASATRIRQEVVNARLAACANQLGPVRSTYRWQGAIEEASEVALLIKTTRERYSELEALIRRLHPYALPEIVAIPVERGCPDYLAWVRMETRADTDENE
ncbi:MAG: divalent-cation tolerance protein CutA [Betaproteobacteria bacterium]|nr:MAG: divalent-cation tolerance protein CutA [Betaproteobacteria bacterium]